MKAGQFKRQTAGRWDLVLGLVSFVNLPQCCNLVLAPRGVTKISFRLLGEPTLSYVGVYLMKSIVIVDFSA